jgi:hypothetical protein
VEKIMPKVTLLDPDGTYTFLYGRHELMFEGGVPKEVAPAVALMLAKRIDRKQKPLFKVEALPTIITPVEPQALADEKNVTGNLHQMKVEDWKNGTKGKSRRARVR